MPTPIFAIMVVFTPVSVLKHTHMRNNKNKSKDHKKSSWGLLRRTCVAALDVFCLPKDECTL